MSAGRSFVRGLALALVASLALPVIVAILSSVVTTGTALALYLVFVAASSAALDGEHLRGALGRFLGLVIAALLAFLVIPDASGRGLAGLCGALALLVSVQRVLLDSEARRARQVLVEGSLLVLGLLLARFLVGASVLSWSAALWGYLLVQSVRPLLAGPFGSGRAEAPADAFEGARARLEALLDDA